MYLSADQFVGYTDVQVLRFRKAKGSQCSPIQKGLIPYPDVVKVMLPQSDFQY